MISRDGFQSSLWQETTDIYQSQFKHPLKEFYDVIVVGGGIAGVSSALALAREGVSCLLLEAKQLCFGTTAGTTAHINTLLDVPYTELITNFGLEGATEVRRAAEQAIETMRSNVRSLEINCGWQETRAHLFSETEDQSKELESIFDACRQLGLIPEWLKDLPVPIPFRTAIEVGPQARFHPVRYVHALAQEFESLGGKLIDNCRVTKMNESSDQVEVETSQGTFRGNWIVLATHIPPTVNMIHLRCAPFRSYAMAMEIAENQQFEELVYDMQDPYHYYRMQEVDGNHYLIAGGKDHKTGHEKNTAGCIRALEAHVRKYFDVKRIVNTWSSQYYEPADGLPYIGHLPGHSERVLTTTGFGGNGMTYSTIAADVIRDIVFGRETSLVKLFSPTRIKPIASFKNFTSHNLDVTKKLIGSLFKGGELDSFADLAHDDAKVITVEGEKVALSKDDQGAMHAVNATCTHFGCSVAWNNFEKSWDCPCHGARFDVDGTVLNGPAVNDLEYINIEIIGSVSKE